MGNCDFSKCVFFNNKAVAPFIFNELYRVPQLEYKKGLEKFYRSLAKAQFGNANLLEILKHHSSLAFSWWVVCFEQQSPGALMPTRISPYQPPQGQKFVKGANS